MLFFFAFPLQTKKTWEVKITKSVINKQLHRPIIKTTDFDKYMPDSDCSGIMLGSGDTFFGIQAMKDWVLKYAHHTELLAPLLKKSSLKSTCSNIHSFLFNHLQYKIDEDYQQLRSPACSWASRREGIDCKSYTIFGSTILYNLGINHYLRRIKKKETEGYSHVYLVIPNNQDDNNLDYYFVIDGTIPVQKEVMFYQNDDIFIQGKTKITGLGAVEDQLDVATQNASANTQELVKMRSAQIKAGYAQISNAVFGVASGVLMATGVGAIVSGVVMAVGAVVNLAINLLFDPCEGAVYDAKDIGLQLESDFLPNFKNCLKECRKAAAKGIIEGTIGTLNTLLYEIDLGVAHFNNEKNTHDGNACSKQSLMGYAKYVQAIKDVIDRMYDAFVMMLEREYDVKELDMPASTSDRTWFFIVPVTRNPISSKYRRIKISAKVDNPHVAYPYDSDKTFRQWLEWNMAYFKVEGICNSSRINDYYAEMLPFGAKIIEIRSNIYLPAMYRHDQESKLRSEMRIIYLKYDDKYKKYLKEKANKIVEKTISAQKEFLSELTEIRANKIAEAKQNIDNLNAILKARKTKTLMAITALGIITIVVAKKIK